MLILGSQVQATVEPTFVLILLSLLMDNVYRITEIKFKLILDYYFKFERNLS